MHKVDVIIIGGGITGLWLLNTLNKRGLRVLLLEKEALGAKQTMQSQGILHGGTKYALKGQATREAKTLAHMPAIWQSCLAGHDPLDLSAVKVLSSHHYLFSTGQLFGRLKNIVSSHALSQGRYLNDRSTYPLFFQHPEFNGSMCAIDETVIDVPSLIQALSQRQASQILKVDHHTVYHPNDSGGLSHIEIHAGEKTQVIQANTYLFAAGDGNAALLAPFNQAPKMQRRPLHQVCLTFPKDDPTLHVFAHCVAKGTKPLFTITTHRAKNGHIIWYIGGDIAETGVDRDHDAQIAHTLSVLKKHLPWVDFHDVQAHSFRVNRAERHQESGKKPDSYTIDRFANIMVTWPTKLVFVPALAEDIASMIDVPRHADKNKYQGLPAWPGVTVSKPKWRHDEKT